jgi:hypothetical protein
LQIVQISHIGPKVDRRGQYVKSLVHTLLACGLGAQDTTVLAIQEFQVQARGIWIVACMVERVDDDCIERRYSFVAAGPK